MDINKLIDLVEEYFNLSPIRQIINIQKDIPFKEEIIKTIDDINNKFSILKSKLEVPIKVVLMGEVKAGKSTILNALVGKEISLTDVVESTSCIIEVYYNSNEKAIIEFKDKESIEGTLETIQKIMIEHYRDLDFFSNCEKISIGLPLESLRHIHIVDTPGLATITEQNEKKTYEYVENADVVLWAFNSTHLGQEDVKEAMEKVYYMGKIILGVLNKIDCLEISKEEILEYAENDYCIEIYKFFTLSAYEALKAIQDDNKELLEKCGFDSLLNYILNNIDRNSEEIQNDIINNEIKLLINQDREFHKYYNNLLEKIEQSRVKYKKIVYDFKSEMNEKIIYRLNIGVKDFLKEEKEKIIKNNDLCNKYLNSNYINELIEKLISDNKKYIDESWENYLQEYSIEIKNDFNLLFSNFEYKEDSKKIEGINDLELIKEGALKGLMTSGGAGSALAFYSAVLGPAASYITIGQAVTTLCPPLLLAGATAGAIGTYMSKESKENQFKQFIDKEINSIQTNIIENLIPNYINSFYQYNDNIAEYLMKVFEKSIFKDLEGKSFEGLRENIIGYISKSVLDEI